MFNVPVPRRSFLDSRLRSHSHENRRMTRGVPTGDSHLGMGPRAVSPTGVGRRTRSTRPTPVGL